MPYGVRGGSGSGNTFGTGYQNPNYGSYGARGRPGQFQTGNGVSRGWWDPGGGYRNPNEGWRMINDPTREGETWFNSITGQTYHKANIPDPNAWRSAEGRGTGPIGMPNVISTGAGAGKFWWLPEQPDLPEFVAWGGGSGYTAPDEWVAPEMAIPEAGVNIRDIVESRRHMLDEEMGGQMADAARRMGGSGMLMSSDYVDRLGAAERARDRDLAALYYDYDYNAAQQDATRKAAAREAALDRALQSWITHSGYEQEGTMAGLDREFAAWMAENAFNQENYGNQAAWLQNMMPMLLAQAEQGYSGFASPMGGRIAGTTVEPPREWTRLY